MSETTHLGLPYLAAAQAQKHVTHNEALLRLDAVVQLAVIDAGHAAPPASPGQGDRYIIADAATGDWEGHDGEIAAFIDGAWVLIEPGPGWIAFDAAAGSMLIRHGDDWVPLGGYMGAIDRLGVNTTADESNRLAVRSSAVLLTAVAAADGGTGDVRCVLNKEADGDTASFLFQRNYSGRAEIGLAGDTDFVFKVSADGAAWTEAIRIDKTNGRATLAADPASAMQAATKQYVDQIVAAQDAMVFKGVVDCSANPNYPAADRGHSYRVSVAGKIGGGSGINVEAGDLLLCLADGAASGNQATVGANWSIAQANLDGVVIGPASATDGVPVLFDGTTGKLVKATTFSAFKTALALAKADVGLGNVLNYAQREKLAGNRTYYVRTDGSDANDGLANSAGGAFLTIQKAVNVVAALDRDIYNVTISVGSGTFTGGTTITGWGPGSGSVTISGAGMASTTISTTGISCFAISNAAATITGMKLQTTTAGQCIRANHGSTVSFGSIDFGTASIAQLWVEGASRLVCTANYTISAGSDYHLFARYAGCSVEIVATTITLTGTPAFAGGFLTASACATLEMSGNTFSGSATGVRYRVTVNAVLSTSGGGASYLPGNAGGITGTGGQYT